MTLATIAWLSAEVDSSLQKLENDRNFNTFASKVYLNIYLRQVKKTSDPAGQQPMYLLNQQANIKY